jgi:KaiC/GvpD/RAD55 family RecA-like ATPase
MQLDAERFSLVRDDGQWLENLVGADGESRLLTSTSEIARSLQRQFAPSAANALTLPWPDVHELVRFLPGKTTIWSGPTFSGKTQFLRQLMLWALKNGQRVFFASLEEEPLEVFREFIATCAHRRDSPAQFVEDCLDLWDERLFVFDSTEMIAPERLLGLVQFAAKKYAITHVVIDSLMRLAIASDDYEGQRQMGNLISRVARLAGVHIHLVAHPRKTLNSRQSMDLYDIRGAQDLVAQADSVVTLERKHGNDRHCDAELTIWKQRGDINWIGAIRLHYDHASRQLKYRACDAPMRFISDEAYEVMSSQRRLSHAT